MASDKILNRIQGQIDSLAPVLELFVDTTIQPSVQDCELLQKQLWDLVENVAIYKYNKQNKELSPSFNIHAKVSEVVVEEERKAGAAKKTEEPIAAGEKKVEVPEKKEEEKRSPEPVISKPVETQPASSINDEPLKAPVAIGINDKFRFINELFSQNSAEYNIAIEQINQLKNWNESEIYLNSLKAIYEWEEKEEVVIYFYTLVKRRFS